MTLRPLVKSFPLLFALLAAGCSKEAPKDPSNPSSNPPAKTPDEHGGPSTALGEVKIGAHTFQVAHEGSIAAGKEAHVDLTVAAGAPLPETVRGWIGNEDAVGSRKETFSKETATGMHGHVEAPDPIPAGAMLWIEVEEKGTKQKGSVALSR